MKVVAVRRGYLKRKTDRMGNPVNLPKVPGVSRRPQMIGRPLPWERKVRP